MKSLDTLLAEAVGEMKPATRTRFHKQTRGENISQESLINIAEAMVREDGEQVSESRRPIRRNNGASTYAESDPEAESERVLMEGLAKARPDSFRKFAELKEAEGRRTPQQQKDYEFCKLLGMSEADAIKVAGANCIQD